MIIAKDFIIIGPPKTASTYIRYFFQAYSVTCLYGNPRVGFFLKGVITRASHSKNLFKHSIWIVPRVVRKILFWLKRCNLIFFHEDQHNGCYQIPIESRHKEIISVLRDPYKQRVSHYCYHYRTGKHTIPFMQQLRLFTEEIVPWYAKDHLAIERLEPKIGELTYYFIRMHFKYPGKILNLSAQAFNDYFNSGEYRTDMYPVTFFRTETLDEQLYAFLKEQSCIDRKALDKTMKYRSKLPRNASKRLQAAYWDAESKAYFEETEWVYIKMVKEFAPLPQDQF